MEQLDDRHYLEPPPEPEWCPVHDYPLPCPECKADMDEWRGEQQRETR